MLRLPLRRIVAAAILALAIPVLLPAPAVAAIWQGPKKDQPAVSGYDPVAYFTAGAPAVGSAEFAYQWQGATFRFSNAANRAAFIAKPESFAPQFGGHCAWAASQGRLAGPDPTIWHIVGGKLYLNCSKEADAKWLADVPANIARGESFWAEQEDLDVEP